MNETRNQLKLYTNAMIAKELERWAIAREDLNPTRLEQGKRALDSNLLWEAADRIRNSKNE